MPLILGITTITDPQGFPVYNLLLASFFYDSAAFDYVHLAAEILQASSVYAVEVTMKKVHLQLSDSGISHWGALAFFLR